MVSLNLLLYNYHHSRCFMHKFYWQEWNSTLLIMVVYYRLHAYMYTFNYGTSLLSRYKKEKSVTLTVWSWELYMTSINIMIWHFVICLWPINGVFRCTLQNNSVKVLLREKKKSTNFFPPTFTRTHLHCV